jgi:transposase-like protein
MVIKVSPVIRVHRKCGRNRNARTLSPKYAIRRRLPRPGNKWDLDEVVLKIAGKMNRAGNPGGRFG